MSREDIASRAQNCKKDALKSLFGQQIKHLKNSVAHQLLQATAETHENHDGHRRGHHDDDHDNTYGRDRFHTTTEVGRSARYLLIYRGFPRRPIAVWEGESRGAPPRRRAWTPHFCPSAFGQKVTLPRGLTFQILTRCI